MINASWHKRHRMPKNPTPAQRIEWHLEHEKQCRCRPMPSTILELIAEHRRSSHTAGGPSPSLRGRGTRR